MIDKELRGLYPISRSSRSSATSPTKNGPGGLEEDDPAAIFHAAASQARADDGAKPDRGVQDQCDRQKTISLLDG